MKNLRTEVVVVKENGELEKKQVKMEEIVKGARAGICKYAENHIVFDYRENNLK